MFNKFDKIFYQSEKLFVNYLKNILKSVISCDMILYINKHTIDYLGK